MTNETVLQARDLKKYFAGVHAVDGINLNVCRGEIYGFLGPNGAGKTTTIGMILGLLHPTAGSIFLFGQPVTPGHNYILRRVGALFGSPAITPYLSAWQNLALLARLTPDLPARRIDETLEIVGLQSASNGRMERVIGQVRR
jgi:ABC-2 type transport system ATP-binding protein